ncbi:hypothetical protein EJ06DRAFT_551003 [Trichodelitschia bisporula]|uniref:Uncharacterized protein n=1 Tax=Trichodelitschia bisporula TaxID=703511 RepID=A0A6G1HNK7_9PEZI|nr:hypothetical protein EJ06DRAFT_551003 [Trichodelitschia bisporula]
MVRFAFAMACFLPVALVLASIVRSSPLAPTPTATITVAKTFVVRDSVSTFSTVLRLGIVRNRTKGGTHISVEVPRYGGGGSSGSTKNTPTPAVLAHLLALNVHPQPPPLTRTARLTARGAPTLTRKGMTTFAGHSPVDGNAEPDSSTWLCTGPDQNSLTCGIAPTPLPTVNIPNERMWVCMRNALGDMVCTEYQAETETPSPPPGPPPAPSSGSGSHSGSGSASPSGSGSGSHPVSGSGSSSHPTSGSSKPANGTANPTGSAKPSDDNNDSDCDANCAAVVLV